jgi:hypothetical protein
MAMALPCDIPTLQALRSKNFTRPDDVFCSTSLLPAFITCTTDPAKMPPKTDHFPVIQVLELEHTLLEHVPTPLYKKIHWEEYRNRLLKTLIGLERRDSYDTVESVMDAIRAVKDAVWATTKAVAKFSKPSPHVKRWYTEEMRDLRRAHARLERNAYAQRFLPDHPVHAAARDAACAYCKAVTQGKAHHWVEWQEKLLGSQVWDVHKFLSATPSDGSASRIPTLVKRQGGRQDIVATAETDEEKCAWLRTEFFPPRMTVSSVPPDPVFPPPAWEWKPVSDDLLHRAAEKMKRIHPQLCQTMY